eukprot:Seg675.23 transcript_id=Seg675.23/GoldUCD/mRNA.D3Y31 product="putative protein KIAA2012-like" protein_id=Seg675.23/GoldUCD/D3Y31
MDNIVERKLSKLSRGIGTLSGRLVRETPVYSNESATDFDFLKEKRSDSLDDLFLLRIRGKDATQLNHHHAETLQYEQPAERGDVHKTYSTRHGNLFLFAENLYLAKKKKRKKSKKKEPDETEEFKYEGTVEDLADSILRFGNSNFRFVGNRKGIRDDRIISVRPGYSPMRYVASVSKLWDPEQVGKLLEENALKERHIERYKKIKLPKIDIIPSSDYDPLLRERPKPYSHVSLPDILLKRDPAPSRIDERDEDNYAGVPHADNASSGYAKSFRSDRKKVNRKKRLHKKSMRVNKLEIQIPGRGVNEIGNSGMDKFDEESNLSEDSDSVLEWQKRVETARNVVDRTFDDLYEKHQEESRSSKKRNSLGSELGGREKKSEGQGWPKDYKSLSSSRTSNFEAKGFEYASLELKQKEELISHLLLQGIGKEASTIESLMSENKEDKQSIVSVDKRSIVSESKIDLSDHVSFPSIDKPLSLSDSSSVRGFKGNALHSSIPSSGSGKSKHGSKESSLRGGLLISSVNKLPPIPATPYVNENGDASGVRQEVKLPVLAKKFSGLVNSKSSKKAESDLDGLFIGGRGIEVADVQVDLNDDHGEVDIEDSISDDEVEDLIKLLRQREDEKEVERGDIIATMENDQLNVDNTGNLEATRHQSPDSGRSSGTGLTAISDAVVVQSEQKKEPMTPLVEESSQSSKTSKMTNREDSVNRTSSSIKQRNTSFITDKSNLQRSPYSTSREASMAGKMLTGASLKNSGEESLSDEEPGSKISSLSAKIEDSLSAQQNSITNDIQEQEGEEGLGADISNLESLAAVENERTTLFEEQQQPSIQDDEGVFVDEENRIVEEESIGSSRDDLTRGRTYTDTRTIADSIDIILEENETRTDKKSMSESLGGTSRSSSGFLQIQANLAAHSALARPQSGMNLIEDMKNAAAVFGKMFGDDIQRASKSGVIRRGRTQSESFLKTRNGDYDPTRSNSAVTKLAAKRMGTVDVDMLTANVTSLGSLIDKKIEQGSIGQGANFEKEDISKGLDVSSNKDQGTTESFPAVSLKSNSAKGQDIQMDIISYVHPERENQKNEPLIQKEVDNSQGSDVVVGEVAAEEKPADTDEEQFQLALKAIVDEVKDLKEKKPAKAKKARKTRTGLEEKSTIVREIASVSPPFRAGRAKESKPPKGLDRIEETKKKVVKKEGKVPKDQDKKVKVGKAKTGKKKVTFVEKKGENKNEIDGDQVKERKKTEIEDLGKGSKQEEVASDKDNISDPQEKYDVPITFTSVRAESGLSSGNEKKDSPRIETDSRKDLTSNAKSKAQETPQFEPNVNLNILSSNETETDGSVVHSGNEDGADQKIVDARTRKRKMEAERRRLKVEQRRREKEEAKRRAIEQAEREEQLKQEAEMEMRRRIEEVKNRKSQEEDENRKQEEAEKARLRKLEREREREKREKEEMKRKMDAIAARLKLEEEMRRERERVAREIEEEMKLQEEEKMKEMEETERIEYERQKREEEEQRLRLEEEQKRIEREKRLIAEEEHRIKMQKLKEFHQMLLERAKFWEGMRNSKWFIELNQRLTRAFTFSYYDLLPAMLFEFTSLRPFTPKEERHGKLPPIEEEKRDT